jgi:NitT/TauT family transport system substrate-binding protein
LLVHVELEEDSVRLVWHVRAFALVVTAAILFGCTAASSPSPTPAPTRTPAASAAPSAAPTVVPETTSFKVAFGGPGISTVALLSAIRILNEGGWKIETPELSAGELQLQGVASGEFQISSGSGPNVLQLAEKGLPVRVVMGRIKNEWTLYSKSEIADCKGLEGVKLAIHSEGSPATFMLRNWIKNNCDGTKPSYLILPGSENRFAALLKGEIDASPIELSDAIALEAQGGDKYRRLTSFAETLPNLMLTPIYANSDWASKNKNTMALLLKAVLEQQRKFNADPAYFKAEVIKTLPNVSQATLDKVIKAYVDLEMYDPTGGISIEQQRYTADFLLQAGLLKPGFSTEQAYDRTYLDAALALLK